MHRLMLPWLAVLVLGCRPEQSELDRVNEKLEGVAQQQDELAEQLERIEANQRRDSRDHDQALVEGQRDRRTVEALTARVEKLLEAQEPGPPQLPNNRPDPETRYRVDVGSAHVRGSNNALVTIVMWQDFQCPFCARVQETLEQVRKRYKGKVRFVFKHNALPFHNRAMPAALAAEAAGRQDKFWQMHDKLYENITDLSDQTIMRLAKKLRLKKKKFKRDLEDAALAKKIEDDQNQGTSLGARGTPAFFINGKFLSGAQPIDAFTTVIDRELAVAKELVKGGTPKSRVYQVLMDDAKAPSF